MPPSINTLPAIAFSRNRLQLVVESADYLAAAAANAVNFLEIADVVAEDTVFLITWSGAAATMTAKDVPDESGLQFPSGDGSEAYVTELVAYFAANPFINRDFVLSTNFDGDHPRIYFTAKKPGPDSNFLTFNLGATGVITPGVTDQPVSNFRHHIETWQCDAAGLALLQAYSANVPLDEPLNGKSTITLQDELHPFLSPDRPVLEAEYALCTNSIKPFRVLYGKFYGDDPSVKKVFWSDLFYLNKGGLGKMQALDRNIVSELCPDTDDPSKNRFLRQGSVNKLITPGQPEWLTWLNFTEGTVTIQAEVVVYNDDLGDPFIFNVSAPVNVPAYGKVQFIAGYAQLDISSRQVGKTPIYYTIQVKSGEDQLSDAYAFVIDYKYREWPDYIIYENSYGAFQTIATVGKGLAEVDREKDDAQKAVDVFVAAVDGDLIESNIRIQDKFTRNIGYERSTRRNVALLRDLLASARIYAWRSGRLMPIGLNTKNLKDAEDGVNVYASTIEYYPLYNDQEWTEELTQVVDDSIADLLSTAGSPIPPAIAPPVDPGGGEGDGTGSAITVLFGDEHLSMVGGNLTYTADILIGHINYEVWTSQEGLYFNPADITYDSVHGSFTIIQEGFELIEGERLIIFPYVLNPD